MANGKKPAISSASGLGVDFAGGPVVDPTANVIALTEATNRRQDDLREITNKYITDLNAAAEKLNEIRIQCQKEIGELRDQHRNDIGAIREHHQEKLRIAESQRLDAIRQVDREDVNKTAAQVLSAVQTLASTSATTAETLRTQVATTAQAATNTFNSAMAEQNKRLAQLEQSSFEGRGKQSLADPMMLEIVAELKALSKSRDAQQGGSAGVKDMFGYIIGAAGLGAAIMMFFK